MAGIKNYRGYTRYSGLDGNPHVISWEIRRLPDRQGPGTIKGGRITSLVIQADDRGTCVYNGRWVKRPNYFTERQTWEIYRFLLNMYN